MPLLLPTALHGRYEDVDKVARRIARDLGRGASWLDATGPEREPPVVRPGLVVLAGPSPLLGGSPQWQMWLPLQRLLEATLKGKAPQDAADRVFAECLADPPGVVALLGSNLNTMWVMPPERHKPFLRAVLPLWADLVALGPVFSAGLPEGAGLWDVNTNVKYVLANLGVPAAELQRPLPEGLGRYATLVA